MEPHPDLDRAGGQPRLGGRGRRQGSGRRGERDEERVALRIDFDAAVRSERRAQDAPVFRERFGVPLAPSSSSSRVEPAMSVNRNVTVPVGRGPCRAKSSVSGPTRPQELMRQPRLVRVSSRKPTLSAKPSWPSSSGQA